MLAHETSPLKQTPLHALHLARGQLHLARQHQARTAQDATYAIEIARSLGFIELNLFGRRTGGADRAAQEAA